MKNDNNYRYFFFSKSYIDEVNEIEKKMGKFLQSGTVIVNGSLKEFNILSKTKNMDRYTDAILVAEGNINKMTYTMPKHKIGKFYEIS